VFGAIAIATSPLASMIRSSDLELATSTQLSE
jgi:hypothetical protein